MRSIRRYIKHIIHQNSKGALCTQRSMLYNCYYRNYYDSYFIPLMDQLGYTQTPHCTRHTCISMLAEAHVDQTMIKKIVGHSGAMTLTEKVYTHLDISALVDAINSI